MNDPKEDSGYIELRPHVEAPFDDRDQPDNEDELGVLPLLFGWVMILGFIGLCGWALIAEWVRGQSW